MAHENNCDVKFDLVHNKALRISYCGCGMINLHMGPISLRISETAFAGFADAVSLAVYRLQQVKEKKPQPMIPVMGQSDYVSG